MASKNRVKIYAPESYYHVYNRGVNKRRIFSDSDDYAVFLNLLKRYLDVIPAKDNKGREYDWLRGKLELQAYCLMPNHFHMLLYLVDSSAMTRLMRGVCTSYTMYFNKKYRRIGPLFQDRYKASLITSDSYLLHISRYIHLNPVDYLAWEYSSLPCYLGTKTTRWVQHEKVSGLISSSTTYLDFLGDYLDHQSALDHIKNELADH